MLSLLWSRSLWQVVYCLLLNADINNTWMCHGISGSHCHPTCSSGCRHRSQRGLIEVLLKDVRRVTSQGVTASDTLTTNLEAKTAITHAGNFHAPCILPLLNIIHGQPYFIAAYLIMPCRSSGNLCVHNAFTLGPQQPTLPCSHPNCPRYVFNHMGPSNHMRATHPPGVSLPDAPNSPQASIQPSSPQSRPSQLPPLSPTTFHLPSSLISHTFKPVLNKDSPVWHNIRSSSPV